MNDERNAAIKSGTKEDQQGDISMSCSYDMAWQKRGKGHNSSTGQAAVMGLTGKVINRLHNKNKNMQALCKCSEIWKNCKEA